ncbi:MAG: glycosyltransferase family 39 protein [Spirochaetales bacterium]|nr:glycosyltransferase family 39 protein [Spirochaetales bacterium]MCF7937278.1 glycosyltransferase family 39 protein [Spirochaetales bacterium]
MNRKLLGVAAAAAAIAAYLLFHIWSLPFFPFVHSDEAWLASLTRSMIESGSLAATEDFFHSTPRMPHAIKILFHLFQMPFIAVDWSAVAARVPSLGAGFASLLFLADAGRRLFTSRFGSVAAGMIPAILLSVDIQFITASHIGRQEIFMVLLMCAGIWYVTVQSRDWRVRDSFLLSLILGAGVFIHPNSFIIALPFPFFLWFLLSRKKSKSRTIGPLPAAGILILGLAVCAASAVAVSFIMDPDFLYNYLEFGREVGVTDHPVTRLSRFFSFFRKIDGQIAGTYFLPPVGFQLRLFLVSWIGTVGLLFIRKKQNSGKDIFGWLLAGLPLVAVGYFLIGKYSPPSILFLFPLGYLGFIVFLSFIVEAAKGYGKVSLQFSKAVRLAGILVLTGVFGFLLWNTADTVLPWRKSRYADYIEAIQRHVPGDATVLANLNTAFAFDHGKLRVFRDLSGPDFPGIGRFLAQERVEYILLPEELELIYRSRPVWNTVYGNIAPWYPRLKDILDEQGEKIAEIVNPVYGMRLVLYQDRKEWAVTVYRIKDRDYGKAPAGERQ